MSEGKKRYPLLNGKGKRTADLKGLVPSRDVHARRPGAGERGVRGETRRPRCVGLAALGEPLRHKEGLREGGALQEPPVEGRRAARARGEHRRDARDVRRPAGVLPLRTRGEAGAPRGRPTTPPSPTAARSCGWATCRRGNPTTRTSRPAFAFGRDEARGRLQAEIARRRDEERARRRTLVGPHADHVEFFIAGRNAALYGSQGQQRSIVLAFKLAEAALIQEMLGQKPVLLLDGRHERARPPAPTTRSYRHRGGTSKRSSPPRTSPTSTRAARPRPRGGAARGTGAAGEERDEEAQGGSRTG